MQTQLLAWNELNSKNSMVHKSQIEINSFYGRKKKFALEKTSYSIGKSKKCDIQLDDPFCSDVHAKLELDEKNNCYLLHDLESRNGTFVNGVRIRHAHLARDAFIKLGQSSIKLSKKIENNEDEISRKFLTVNNCMIDELSKIKSFADSEFPVLITGETGTGKDVIANIIHEQSKRANCIFLALNCGAFNDNLIESELFGHKKGAFTGAINDRPGAFVLANNGTLFMDEIGELSLENQAKLLRVLENKEIKAVGSDMTRTINTRIVFATNKDLFAMVKERKFREDLLYRLSTLTINLKPLRERKCDIELLAKHFVSEMGMTINECAIKKLQTHKYKGNVRELKLTIAKAATLAKWRTNSKHGNNIITEDSIEFMVPNNSLDLNFNDISRSYDDYEKEIIQKALISHQMNKTAAAKTLKISKSTFFEKLKKYKIRVEDDIK